MAEIERLLLDVMLGRLAKWLRLLGHDAPLLTKPPPRARPSELLLTRRVALVGRPGVVFIESDHVAQQLRQVLTLPDVRLAGGGLFSRCARCNEPVLEVDGQAVAGLVPDYTLATARRFTRCPKCGRVFWPGSHGQRAIAFLRQAGLAPFVFDGLPNQAAVEARES